MLIITEQNKSKAHILINTKDFSNSSQNVHKINHNNQTKDRQNSKNKQIQILSNRYQHQLTYKQTAF